MKLLNNSENYFNNPLQIPYPIAAILTLRMHIGMPPVILKIFWKPSMM